MDTVERAAKEAEAPTASPVIESSAGKELICPRCGYDMRAAIGDQCSECGLVVDRTRLGESQIPWVHRKQIGRVRAYLRTVVRISLDRTSLRMEASRPHRAADGRWFIACHALVLWMIALGLSYVLLGALGLERFAIHPTRNFMNDYITTPPMEQEFIVPLSAAWVVPWSQPIFFLGLAVYLAMACKSVIRLPAEPSVEQRTQAAAMGTFAAAPLAWLILLIPVAIGWRVLNADEQGVHGSSWRELRLMCLVLGGLAVLIAMGSTLLRTAQWSARCRHDGIARGVLASVELIVRWAVGVGLFVYFFPWCFGFTWIVIDSYLR